VRNETESHEGTSEVEVWLHAFLAVQQMEVSDEGNATDASFTRRGSPPYNGKEWDSSRYGFYILTSLITYLLTYLLTYCMDQSPS